MPAQGKKNKRRNAVPKKGRDSFFLFKAGGKKKKVRTSVNSKVPDTSRRGQYMMPDWLHWTLTFFLVVLVSVGSYYYFLRPYLYRWRPCQGTKEFGVCLPSGFRYWGIDVSHHQGHIDWPRVLESSNLNGYQIKFVIMKATEGSTFTDPEYLYNIAEARKAGFVCGVYHFYDPGISPQRQAEHYINTVKLLKGDIVPVVDVERSGRSTGDLQRELAVFLKILESHYGGKPVIYASAKFRKRHLNNPVFDEYPFWVAHYYVVRPETTKPWVMWQFTDHASVEGINGYTDFNVFRGSEADFIKLRIEN